MSIVDSDIAYSSAHTEHEALFSLEGKVAVVTGALGLIGREYCHALAGAGANVIVLDLDDDACGIFASELSERVDALGIGADITSKQSLQIAQEFAVAEFGHVDILVNNAAINDKFEDPAMAAELSQFENYPLEAWERSFHVNVTGMFLASQVFGTEMARQRSGAIINIASTYGIAGPDQTLSLAIWLPTGV
jgi:NAD(P)-dependent dehydrogenase (short-subunit alcohol dehydrogenase family)